MSDVNHDDANRRMWNAWTPIHVGSDFYDVAGFKAGRSSLKSVECDALGDVAGKSILHLQCHLGLDTLSLARLGARVTGVDYSEASIAFARNLAGELMLPAQFICCNVYDVGQICDQRFDIVFASYGVLHWLSDLKRLGQLIAGVLKEGGFFYLVEFHPLFNMLDETGKRFVFPYFPGTEPIAQVKKGACMDPTAPVEGLAYEWPHSLSEILMALIDAGLCVTEFREYPFIVFNCLPYLQECGRGRFATQDGGNTLPLMFSVRAEKRRQMKCGNRTQEWR